MSESTLNGANPRLPIYPLRVHRIEEGTRWFLRMLSERIWGIHVHFIRGRSQYCKMHDCPPAMHKEEQVFKGYVSAEFWDKKAEKWMPVALELTEHAEVDMRHVYKRGQVWEMFRDVATKGKAAPVQVVLLEERDEKTFPPALDLVPCLKAFYHVEKISLEAKNWLPDRTLVSPSDGAPPVPFKKEPPVPVISEEERAKVREQIKQWNRRNRMPAIPENEPKPQLNGKHA